MLPVTHRAERGELNIKPRLLYYNWLSERLSNNVPANVSVRTLLGANGGTFKEPRDKLLQATKANMLNDARTSRRSSWA